MNSGSVILILSLIICLVSFGQKLLITPHITKVNVYSYLLVQTDETAQLLDRQVAPAIFIGFEGRELKSIRFLSVEHMCIVQNVMLNCALCHNSTTII